MGNVSPQSAETRNARSCGSGAVLTHVRAVTRPAHQKVEAALAFLTEPISLGRYQTVLERFYGFWLGWESQVTNLLQDEALMKPRRRLHMLASDLAALGVSIDALKALPQCPLITLHDGVEALGSLYVMEGSTLGGRVIRQNLMRCLGADAPSVCSYFNGYGGDTSPMWRSFLARLEEESACDAEKIGAAASRTFDRLGGWISGMEGFGRLPSAYETEATPAHARC
jgi:heme oxygenase (biliverdin-IX-beta and delta-forming)